MNLFKRAPRFNKDGSLKISSINKLSFNELKDWIKEILEDNIPGYLIDRNDIPFSFLDRIYHQLDIRSRNLFEDAILEHLKDLSRLSPVWLSNAGDELLLLTTEVFKEKHLQKKPLNTLLSIVQNRKFKSVNGFNLHKRSYQTLLGLEYLAPEEFWTNLFKTEGEDYISIVIGGLALQRISGAIDWVISNGNIDKVFYGFLDYLPWIIENYPIEKVKGKLYELSFTLKPELRGVLNQNLLALGINEVSVDNNLPMSLMKRAEIEQILRTLGGIFRSKARKEELFQELIRRVYFFSTREEIPGSVPFLARVIIRLTEYMKTESLIECNPAVKSTILGVTDRYRNYYGSRMDTLGRLKLDGASFQLQHISSSPEEDYRRFSPNANPQIH